MQLLKRNYNPYSIAKCIRLVSNIERNDLLPYKNKSDIFSKNNILFFSTFDNSIPNLNQLISSSIYKNFNNSNLLVKPISIIQNNLGSILIHNKPLISKYSLNFAKPCGKCKVCKFVNLNNHIKIRNLKIPIFCFSSCESENIVYIIYCSKCSLYYIGETSKSAKIRISRHLNSISSFSKNINFNLSNFDHCSPVGEHFSRNDHSLDHFSFFIFQKNIEDNVKRKSIENNLINLCVKLNQKILNKLIPNYKNTSTLCFN